MVNGPRFQFQISSCRSIILLPLPHGLCVARADVRKQGCYRATGKAGYDLDRGGLHGGLWTILGLTSLQRGQRPQLFQGLVYG